MSDLINLKCPCCGSPLNVVSTQMKTMCQFCGTEILVKDFITERRVDKSDKMEAFQRLADNAIRNSDYSSAYNYYDKMCQLDSSKKYMVYLNLYSFLSGKTMFNINLINDLYYIPAKKHREILNVIFTFAVTNKKNDLIKVPGTVAPNYQKAERNRIVRYYDPIIRITKTEIKKLKPRKCRCGNDIEFNDTFCSMCGTNYYQWQADIAAEKARKRMERKEKFKSKFFKKNKTK